jgi:hypothetical protein
MKKLLSLLVLLCLEKNLHAQYIYTIKADSVKITNSCDTAELIIENHTQNVCGFLFNKGRGRTEFRRGLIRLNDSISVIGCDTLKLNPWLQGGNRFGTIGVFGTMDNNHIDLYSNGARRGRLTSDGSFQVGNIYEYGDKFMVSQTGIVSIPAFLSRSSDIIQIGRHLNSGDGQNAIIRTSNNGGASYRNILVERDGNIGLGSSNRPLGGWLVGDPALRIYDNGQIHFASNYMVFGNVNGEANSSGLYTYVSDFDEWKTGAAYPNRLYSYYFGTRLTGPIPVTNARADLKIGGRNLRFLTGPNDEGVEAATITENLNMLVGTTSDNGNKFQVNGASWFGNTAYFSHPAYATGGMGAGMGWIGNNIFQIYGGPSHESLTFGPENKISANCGIEAYWFYARNLQGGGGGYYYVPADGGIYTTPNRVNHLDGRVYHKFTVESPAPGSGNGETTLIELNKPVNRGVNESNLPVGGREIGLRILFNGDLNTASEIRALETVNGDVRLHTTSGRTSIGLDGSSTITSRLDVSGEEGYNQLRLRKKYTPTSSSDTNGAVGDVSWDDNYIYIKTSSGWKRSALSTF